MKTSITLLSVITLFGLMISYQNALSQEDKSKRPSPPAEVSKKVSVTTITIQYSQPSVKDREIWGQLVPYGKVWRAGANEATTFSIDKAVKIDGKSLAAGRYGLFVIPNEKEWIVIFNSVADQWGAFSYDEKHDVLRITTTPVKSAAANEKLIYTIDVNGLVTLAWENKQISFIVK